MAVVLLAHGSRHPQAGAGVEALAASVAAETGVDTRVAYLDLQQPALIDVASPGDTVVPLLFTKAFHATHDVPQATRGLEVRLTGGLTTLALVDALAPLVTSPTVLWAVGSSSGSPEVHALAFALTTRTGHSVTVGFATRGPALAELLPAAESVQVIPLFVTHGLLLDQLAEQVANLDRPGVHLHPPLTTLLTPVVTSLLT
ncbi:sirohydrochlorin chelatase [Corynebacterium epidermidicanis]|uniref:Sirohydrochlorin ferrochelatase n=1 Tax=Corynebacterium epidermidicanis TaxID=1050174 RepID=A0A0G3GY59_9CORY|nr:CbiX/SirB N-terminal domain-containing protein [Corynebacterium epidermidicanis]AKK03762.1 hypothetical protein CEPID_09585 [Corynebacterium epidermidicanis]